MKRSTSFRLSDKHKTMFIKLCKQLGLSQCALIEGLILDKYRKEYPEMSLVFVVTSYTTFRGPTTSDTDIIGVAPTFQMAKRLAERDCAKHFEIMGEWEDDGKWYGETDFLNPNEDVYEAPPSMLIGDNYRYNITPCYLLGED